MDEVNLVRVLASFAFVLALMYALAWLVKRFGLHERYARAGKGQPTMEVVESLFLDPKRRMVIVRRGQSHYVMLLGQTNETLIDTYLEAREPVTDATTPE